MLFSPDDPEPYTIERDLYFTQLREEKLEAENKALKEKCEKLEGLALNTLQVLGSRNMCPDTVIDLYDSIVDKLKEIKGGEK